MCKDCVEVETPSRSGIVLDTGIYFKNFKGCSNCGCKSVVNTPSTITVDDEEDSEITKFEHKCEECGHVIAKHSHFFSHDDEFQHYAMTCVLCGMSQDSRSIYPDDPRKKPPQIF